MENMKITDMERDYVLTSFKYVLEGKQKQMPSDILNDPKAKLFFIECVKYYFEEVLQEPLENLKKVNPLKFFNSIKLNQFLKLTYGSSYDAVLDIFPDMKVWEFNILPCGVFSKIKQEYAIHIIEEVLGLNESNVLETMDTEKALKDIPDIKKRFGGIAKLINSAYPNLKIEYIKTVIKSRTTTRTMKNYYNMR